MAELADAHDSKSCGETRVGSTPTTGTTLAFILCITYTTIDSGKSYYGSRIGGLGLPAVSDTNNFAESIENHFSKRGFRNPSPGRAVAARGAHNPEVVGSNPTPATKFYIFKYKIPSSVHTERGKEETGCRLEDTVNQPDPDAGAPVWTWQGSSVG